MVSTYGSLTPYRNGHRNFDKESNMAGEGKFEVEIIYCVP